MDDINPIAASYRFFNELKCCSRELSGDDFHPDEDGIDDSTALNLVDEEKMRCHVINCLEALNIIQWRKREKKVVDNEELELVKRKVFAAAISMIIDAEFDSDEVVTNTLLQGFPDKSKMFDERLWLPMHFAIALSNGNKINQDDIHILYAADPFAMQRFSEREGNSRTGYTPAHILCMQKEPNMSLVRYFCLCHPKAFLLCDQSGRCALHLAAEFSESLELLQSMLQIDHEMVRITFLNDSGCDVSPFDALCGRLEFPRFHDMIACFIGVDSSVDTIFSAMIGCMQSYEKSILDDISLGSRGERTLILLEKLLNANPSVTTHTNSNVTTYDNMNILHEACMCLRGELGIAVIKLFLTSNGMKSVEEEGYLPIHFAALYSSLDMMKFLYMMYPESLSMITRTNEYTLLHLACGDCSSNFADINAKVEYLCGLCPAFMHMKDNSGNTPLQKIFRYEKLLFDMGRIESLCSADETVVRDKCTPSDIEDLDLGRLPLHLLIDYEDSILEVSVRGDCFRLLLRLYPASAGIKDGHSKSPYDLAVLRNLSAYFIRLLLSADPTIDPEKRHNLNYAARREGMFLAFTALSANRMPIIWAKIRYESKDLLAHVVSYL